MSNNSQWSLTLVTFRPVNPQVWGDGEEIRAQARRLREQGRSVLVRNGRGLVIESLSSPSALSEVVS